MAGASDHGRRAPPAFQMYAPDRLADRNFKAMSAAERRAGEMLAVLERSKGGRGKTEASVAQVYRDNDIAPTTGKRWQRLAAVPAAKFEQAVEAAKQVAGEVTTAALLRLNHNHRAQYTGETEWYTPAEYLESVRSFLGSIDLDPASSDKAQKTVQAKKFYTQADDGLSKKWHGKVWMNPPYMQPLIHRFIEKLVAERGVLHTMELECWVNGSVPDDLSELGRVLGIEKAELEAALTDRVMHFFERVETPSRMIVSPELLAYRAKLDERHAKMADGGHQTQQNREKPSHPSREPASHPASHPTKEPDSPLRGEERQGTAKSVYKGNDEHAEFIAAADGPAPFEQQAAGRRGNGAARV